VETVYHYHKPKYPSQNKHNRATLYFDDQMMLKITEVVSRMIDQSGENHNISEAVRYLIREGLKNYEFYTRYNARVDFKREMELSSTHDQSE